MNNMYFDENDQIDSLGRDGAPEEGHNSAMPRVCEEGEIHLRDIASERNHTVIRGNIAFKGERCS